MSGPIVRSGASPEFSKNWENIFGKPAKTGGAAGKAKRRAAGKKSSGAPKATATKSAKAKPAAKKTVTKKTASKGKKAGKK